MASLIKKRSLKVERKSSINIQPTNVYEFLHNDRSIPTKNSIFSLKDNYCSLSGKEATELYKKDITEKIKKYEQTFNKKLHSKTKLLFSAVVNLNEKHTPQDVQKIANYLKKKLWCEIYQISIHRDEGHVNEKGEGIINHHAHIVFSGLDYQGRSVRRKLTKQFLRELQTETARLLNMERGTDARVSKRKRLGTYEYKEYKKREQRELNKIKTISKTEQTKLKLENAKLKKELKEQEKKIFDLMNEREKLLFDNYELKEEIKTLNEENNELMKENESLIKDEQKYLNKIEELQNIIKDLRKQMIEVNKNSPTKIFNQKDYLYLSELKKLLKVNNIEEMTEKILKMKKKIDKYEKQVNKKSPAQISF